VVYAVWVLLFSEVVPREGPSHRECRAREGSARPTLDVAKVTQAGL